MIGHMIVSKKVSAKSVNPFVCTCTRLYETECLSHNTVMGQLSFPICSEILFLRHIFSRVP